MWQNTNDWLCIWNILYRNTHKSIQALQENIFSLMYDIHKYHLALYDQALHAKQIAGFPMDFYVVSSNCFPVFSQLLLFPWAQSTERWTRREAKGALTASCLLLLLGWARVWAPTAKAFYLPRNKLVGWEIYIYFWNWQKKKRHIFSQSQKACVT